MAAKLKGSVTIEADKDYKKGDKIAIEDKEFTADQDDFEAALEQRLKRERKKTSEAEERLAAAEAELTEAKKKGEGKGAEVDTKTAERLQKLEDENKALSLQIKLDSAIKKAGVELPEQFRKAISLKPNASEDAIDEAVKEQVKAFNDLKKALGAPEKKVDADGKPITEEPKKPGEGIGAGGSGDPQMAAGDKAKLDGLMARAKLHMPHMVGNLERLNAQGQMDTLLHYEANKLLEPKAK